MGLIQINLNHRGTVQYLLSQTIRGLNVDDNLRTLLKLWHCYVGERHIWKRADMGMRKTSHARKNGILESRLCKGKSERHPYLQLFRPSCRKESAMWENARQFGVGR